MKHLVSVKSSKPKDPKNSKFRWKCTCGSSGPWTDILKMGYSAGSHLKMNR
jgi:hypothetical protein